MSRRHGPTQGAGTVVVEQDAANAIVPAPTGSTGFVGITEKGDVGELIVCNGQADYLRQCGTYIDGTELPDSALDFFRFSQGGGSLFVVRVTDGNEISAVDKVFSRHTGRGEYLNRDSGNTTRAGMLTITAKNGGRWGGSERVRRDDGWTILSDLTETTLATGVTMLANEWEGATLRLLGVTSKTYTVVSNTVAGIITVESDSTMLTDLAASATPATNDSVLYFDNETRTVNAPGSVNGARKELGLVWKDGEEDPDAYFGLDIVLDGAIVRSYNNLSLDPTNKWYITNVINQDPSNKWIDATVDHSGSISRENRPADWYGTYQAFSGTTLTIQAVRVSSVSSVNGDVGFVTGFDAPDKMVRGRMKLTFTDATNFDVSFDGDYGFESTTLVSGTVGTAYVPGDEFVPGFTVRAGVDAFSSGDVITIDIDPFPVDLADETGLLAGRVFVNAGSDRTEYAIDDNAVDTITLKNAPDVTPTADGAMSAAVTLTTIGTAITFPFTAAVTLDYVSDDDGLIQISITSATYATIADVITALNGEQTTGTRDPFFIASVATADAVAVSHALYTSTATGEECFVRSVVGSAELNITADVFATGVVGDEFRVEAPRTLRGGYDGDTPSDSDYTAAYNTVTSDFNKLRGRNAGLVKLATPGVTVTAIQKAGLAYANARNYQYRIEFPANITDEASAVAYINDTIGRDNYGVVSWPSYGYVVNPLGSGTVLQTLTGAIIGREAAVARDFKGYHKAGAGISVTLPHMIESPLGERVINEEITNPQGINVIKKMKGNFVVWGDRTISLEPGWKWKHQREYMSHIENVLLESFDWLIFAINDATTRRQLDPVFRAFFLPEWQKRAISGKTLDDAASIKIDDENNTNLTISNGDLNAEISLRLAGTVERFIITIGKKGIFDQAA